MIGDSHPSGIPGITSGFKAVRVVGDFTMNSFLFVEYQFLLFSLLLSNQKLDTPRQTYIHVTRDVISNYILERPNKKSSNIFFFANPRKLIPTKIGDETT